MKNGEAGEEPAELEGHTDLCPVDVSLDAMEDGIVPGLLVEMAGGLR